MNAGRFQGRWPVLEGGLLDPGLDLDALAGEFAGTRRLQIDHALRPEVADFLHGVLRDQVPWYRAFRTRAGEQKVPLAEIENLAPDRRSALEAEIAEVAREGFQFSYLTYMMITAYLGGHDPDLPLHRVVELVNRGDWLEPMRRITGAARAVRTNCQATRYRSGDFLTLHNDFSRKEERLVAYVINLGRDWKPDQGGLLQFFDEAGNVIGTMVPRFNTINLFATPQLHCVSPVAAHATGTRMAITGWLMA